MALIDYSRAYDKVWQDALLFKMQQMGVPTKMLRWVQAWLSNRLTWVTFDGEKSKTVILKQGVPQGSVLSPLLFLFYINDLPNGIAQSNVSLYADNVAFWSQASGLLQAEHGLQTNLNHIAEWSKWWKVELFVQKSECSFFTISTHEASWRPNLKLSNHALEYNPLPKFFGVTYDRQLTFVPHAATVGQNLRRQASALRSLATTDWGYNKQTLRATFIATGRSAVEYTAAAWLPWVSSSTMEKLETCQRFAGRAITGQVKTTPEEAIFKKLAREPHNSAP